MFTHALNESWHVDFDESSLCGVNEYLCIYAIVRQDQPLVDVKK